MTKTIDKKVDTSSLKGKRLPKTEEIYARLCKSVGLIYCKSYEEKKCFGPCPYSERQKIEKQRGLII